MISSCMHLLVRFRIALFAIVTSAVVSVAISAPAAAVTDTILHSFVDTNTSPDGSNPFAGVILASDGNLYGTTYEGGSYNDGSLYEYNQTTKKTIVLHSFGSGRDGQYPAQAPLVEGPDGNLYGLTSSGGAADLGTLYEYNMTTKVVSILHSFADGTVPNDGMVPWNGMIVAADGNLYGTAIAGGLAGNGALFEYNLTTRKESALYSFGVGRSGGYDPQGGLTQAADGNLYGTTIFGGANGLGTIFEFTIPGGVETDLHSFSGEQGPLSSPATGKSADAYLPSAPMIQLSDGNLYGTSVYGGTTGFGTIFKYNLTTHAETVLHSFDDGSVSNDGAQPLSSLLLAEDGNLFGTTSTGGSTQDAGNPNSGAGVLFEYSPSTSTETVLHSFDDGSEPNDGANPQCNLIEDPAGNLDGTTYYGGTADAGTLFQLTQPYPQPMIAAISPASVLVGSPSFTLEITGTGFYTATTVDFNGVPLAPTSVTYNAIYVTVPASFVANAGSYTVKVVNPGTLDWNKTLTVYSRALISSLSPPSAAVGSSSFPLTINGTGFTTQTTVKFNGTKLTPSTVTSTAITVIVPASLVTTAGTYGVMVYNPVGSNDQVNFYVYAPVTIKNLTPASALVDSGAFSLDIYGTNFGSATIVQFNGTILTPSSVTDTMILVTVPASLITSVGSVPVVVYNPDTAPASSPFMVYPPALITSLSPSSVWAGSAAFPLTIKGTGFYSTTIVWFNGTVLTPTSVSSTAITVTVPASLVTNKGIVVVEVFNPNGPNSHTNFTITAPPI